MYETLWPTPSRTVQTAHHFNCHMEDPLVESCTDAWLHIANIMKAMVQHVTSEGETNTPTPHLVTVALKWMHNCCANRKRRLMYWPVQVHKHMSSFAVVNRKKGCYHDLGQEFQNQYRAHDGAYPCCRTCWPEVNVLPSTPKTRHKPNQLSLLLRLL